MFATKLKIAAAALIATCTVGVPGVLAYQIGGQQPVEVGKASSEVKKAANPPGKEAPTSMLVEPGTEAARERETIVAFAGKALKILEDAMANDATPASVEGFYVWSRRLAEAKAGPTAPEPERKAALQEHVDRMRTLNQVVQRQMKEGRRTELDAMGARYRRIEADRWLREGKIDAIGENPPTGGGFGNDAAGLARKPLALKTMPGDEKRNQAILAKLEEPLAMNFAQETPLADVLKYIKDATQDEAAGLPGGIPIYVDPIGLQDADKTVADTVSLQLEGIPLRTTLRLALHQLALVYRVEAGLLVVTSENEPPPAAATNPTGMGGMGGGFR